MSLKSIKLNYFYSLISQVLALISPFITTPYLSRVLSPEGIGIQSLSGAVAQYFVMFASMGISIYGQREISYHQDDLKARTQIFWELKILSLITSVICLVIYLIFVNLKLRENYYVIYLIMSLNILGVFLDVSWLFAGMEEFGRLVLRGIIVRIVDITFIFIFVKSPEDLTVYILGTTLIGISGGLSLFPELKNFIGWPEWSSLRPFRNLKVIWALFIPTIAVQVYTVFDKTMLGFFTEGSLENGYYEMSLRVSRIVLMVVTSLGGVMIPRIGYLFKKGDEAILKEYMYRSYKFVLLLSIPMCLGLVVVSNNFIVWFLGRDYIQVASLLKISSFLLIAIGINNITGVQYLIPTGRENLFTISVVIGAVTNFTLNLILINYFKSYGALVASVTAESVIAIYQLYKVRKELSIAKIFSSGRNYYLAGLIMFGSIVPLKKLPPSPLNTFIIILLGALVYCGVLLIFRDEFFIDNSLRALNFLTRKLGLKK